MAPPKRYEEEEDSDSSTPPSSPPLAIPRRSKFDDEEDDSDVVDNWDEAEDSEVEREKAKKAAEAKAQADALAAANKKPRAQRIEEKRMAAMRRMAEDEEESSDDEDEGDKRERLRKTEQESDLKHAEDLFGTVGISKDRTKPVVAQDPTDPTKTIDLAALPLFNPTTKDQFARLRETVAPLINGNSRKAHYILFMQEFSKMIVKDLQSDQIKKIASGLTTLSNEKMKEEKLAEKGGKKTKAAKTKVALSATRDVSNRADTTLYNEGLDE
ncbi:Translation initiation factor 3 subunit J component [Agyrium rufum]|nr:Translation initiation factor 3 subunit J component [Agyrium rufum]